MTRRPFPTPRELLFALAAVAAFLLAAECVARMAWKLPVREAAGVRYAADPELVFELKPSAAFTAYGRACRTNRLGLLADREIGPERPPGVYRIASLGDSIAFMSPGRTYAQLLPDAFAAAPLPGGRTVEVLDFAVWGYCSRQERVVLHDRALPLRPDLVLVGYCENDAEFPGGLDGLPYAGHPASPGRRLHSRLVQFLQDRFYTRYRPWEGYHRPNYGNVRVFFEDLARVRRARTAEVLILFFPPLVHPLTLGNTLVATPIGMARALGLPFLAPADLFGATDLTTLRYSPPDDSHVNEAGHRAIARAAAEKIRRMEEANRARP